MICSLIDDHSVRQESQPLRGIYKDSIADCSTKAGCFINMYVVASDALTALADNRSFAKLCSPIAKIIKSFTGRNSTSAAIFNVCLCNECGNFRSCIIQQ